MRPAPLALYATLTVGLALGLSACSEEAPNPGEPTTADDSTSDSPSAGPAEPPSESSDDESTGTGSPDAGDVVPVYFTGDWNGRPALFREFQHVSGDPLLGAAEFVDGGAPLDPDYRTEWPGVGVETVQATDGVLLVRIAGDGFTERPDGMSKRSARLAIQQMVYTLQGVQQERVPVQFQRTGEARLFGIGTESPFVQARPLSVLNHVNITSPEEGATASGDTLTVSGVANSFEANVVCELVASDQVVATVPITASGWMGDKLFPFEGELPLADAGTGDVLVRCSTDDASGGAEGRGAAVDTKLVTVD